MNDVTCDSRKATQEQISPQNSRADVELSLWNKGKLLALWNEGLCVVFGLLILHPKCPLHEGAPVFMGSSLHSVNWYLTLEYEGKSRSKSAPSAGSNPFDSAWD